MKKEVIHMGLFSKGVNEMSAFIQSLKKPSMGLNSKADLNSVNPNNVSLDSQL